MDWSVCLFSNIARRFRTPLLAGVADMTARKVLVSGLYRNVQVRGGAARVKEGARDQQRKNLQDIVFDMDLHDSKRRRFEVVELHCCGSTGAIESATSWHVKRVSAGQGS